MFRIGTDQQQRLLLLDETCLAVQADSLSQGARCKRNFKDGFLLPTFPLIIIMHARRIMMGLEPGLFNAANFANGRRTVRYCELVAIVRFSSPFYPITH
jgi:hypothetical protein